MQLQGNHSSMECPLPPRIALVNRVTTWLHQHRTEQILDCSCIYSSGCSHIGRKAASTVWLSDASPELQLCRGLAQAHKHPP